VWYNADLIKQAGAKTPRELEKEGKWTWDALLDVSRQVTRTQGDTVTVYGFNYPFSATGTVLCSLYAWGADWFDKGFTKATIDSPQFLASTQFAVDMVARHRVAGGGDFVKGQLAMMITAPGFARTVEEQIRAQNLFTVEMGILPKGPAGRAVPMANATTYLAKASKEPDASWLFIRFLESQEAQTTFLPNGNARYAPSKRIKPGTVYPFEDAAVYEASRAISVPTPLIAKQADLDREWTTAWNDMIGGKRGVRDALVQVQDRAGQLLKQGGCLC
jgi:ABC-type glycerol-3-phosphate transport system substrate-binding protein